MRNSSLAVCVPLLLIVSCEKIRPTESAPAAEEAQRSASAPVEAAPTAEGSVMSAAAPPADRSPLAVAPPEDAPAMSDEMTEVCADVAAIANDVRANGARLFAMSASGAITVPDWRAIDAAENIELAVEGLYDGWCEEPARVNDSTGAPLTDDERASCNAQKKARLRDAYSGSARIETALVDIDRDGDEEKIFQAFADPARALSGPASDFLWSLQPRIFVSPQEDPSLHRQLHRTLFAPEASLFYRAGELYALRAWNGAPDRYEIFWVKPAAGRLAQIPLCQLKAQG